MTAIKTYDELTTKQQRLMEPGEAAFEMYVKWASKQFYSDLREAFKNPRANVILGHTDEEVYRENP